MADDEKLLNWIWSKEKSRTSVIAEAYHIRLTRDDILTLANTEWLNDKVIRTYIFFFSQYFDRYKLQILIFSQVVNYYFALIAETSPNNVHVMDSVFFPMLWAKSPVHQFTRRVNVFEFDMVLIPVFLTNHWSLLVKQIKFIFPDIPKSTDIYNHMLMGYINSFRS